MNSIVSAFPFGMNAIIAYHILSFIFWIIFQTLSLSTFSNFASWGIPDTSEFHIIGMKIDDGYPIGTQIIAVAFADFVVLLPLMIAATAGLINHSFYGVVCSWMIFSINIYRTSMILWQAVTSYTIIATEPIEIAQRVLLYTNFTLSVWGVWFQLQYFKVRRGEDVC